MAGETRPQAISLIERLRADPAGQEFFPFLRRLDCSVGDWPRLGTARDPAKEALRFGQLPTLAFTGSSFAEVRARESSEEAPLVLVNFFGLLGPNGALPLHLTRYVADRILHKGDHTFASFLDLFHHRLLCLFYRAWASAHIEVSFDRPEKDRFQSYVGSLFGFGTDASLHQGSIPDSAKLYYAGRLAGTFRNAQGLSALLTEFFFEQNSSEQSDLDHRPTADIEPFFGRWQGIPDELCSRLDGSATIGGPLMKRVVLGNHVWDCQQQFRVRLGPLSLEQYRSFLPRSHRLKRLTEWVRTFVGDELSWDVQLCIAAKKVPPLQLDGQLRLGWDTWLAHGPQHADRNDLVLDPLVSSP